MQSVTSRVEFRDVAKGLWIWRAQQIAGDTRTGPSASGRPCRALRWKRAPRDARLAAGATGDSLWRRANGTGWQAPSLVFSVAREAGVASVERIAQASI